MELSVFPSERRPRRNHHGLHFIEVKNEDLKWAFSVVKFWFQKVLNRKWKPLQLFQTLIWGQERSCEVLVYLHRPLGSFRDDRGNTKSTGQQLCEALQFMSQYCTVLSTHLGAENSSLPMSFLAHEGLQILVISSGIARPCKIPPLSAFLPYTLTRNDYSRRIHQGTV